MVLLDLGVRQTSFSSQHHFCTGQDALGHKQSQHLSGLKHPQGIASLPHVSTTGGLGLCSKLSSLQALVEAGSIGPLLPQCCYRGQGHSMLHSGSYSSAYKGHTLFSTHVIDQGQGWGQG